jgi:hypothetical protein
MFEDNIAKQIIDFQKSAFDNSYGAVVMLQNQTQAAFNTVLEQTPWVPRESRNAIDGWIQMCKTGRDEYKRLVDSGFDTLTGLYPKDKKPATKTKSPKAKKAA